MDQTKRGGQVGGWWVDKIMQSLRLLVQEVPHPTLKLIMSIFIRYLTEHNEYNLLCVVCVRTQRKKL